MSVIGKGTLSIKKKEVAEQKTVALGFKKVKFAHQASAGQTGFNLGTLVTPTDMSTLGFVQPSAATLLKGNLFTFRNNLKLVSSLRGLLIDQLSYVVSSSSQITFVGFTAAEGEIFVGHFDEAPATSLSVVDGRTIVASGILAAGQTDFNIGTPIVINQNPGTQIGAVMVFADRGLQYRKVGNSTTNDGDYIEVPVAGGVGSLIRFNASAADRFISVISNGVVAERPDGSMMAAIERVQGQVDAMVPVLSAAAGVPTTTFQTGPSNVDLKQFGDTLSTAVAKNIEQDARLTVIENGPPNNFISASPAAKIPPGSGIWLNITGNSVLIPSAGTWLMNMRAGVSNSGATPGIGRVHAFIGGANGTDTSTFPAGVQTLPTFSGSFGPADSVCDLPSGSDSPDFYVHVHNFIIVTTGPMLVYGNIYTETTTPANCRAFSTVWGWKIK